MSEHRRSLLLTNEYNSLIIIGGTIVLFDRKMLRNFRKDGYNWKKKKDGKTIKEAHEHLKVGFAFRITYIILF